MAKQSRSLVACEKGIERAQIALTGRSWNQYDLAEEVDISRKTVTNFLGGKPVDRKNFVKICNKLELDWQEICGMTPPAASETDFARSSGLDSLVKGVRGKIKVQFRNLDELAKEVRQKVRDDIQNRCGTMRVLDMTQPIGLGNIYTQVNILEKIIGRRRLNINQLLENFSSDEFDRFGLSCVTEERVLGLEAVRQHHKLMVLGKPGAGKTTFLKYLAIQCNGGEFQGDRVPIFIPLKEFAETPGQLGVLDYIARWLETCGMTEARSTAERLLKDGRGLVLLDGLDEVREEDSHRVIDEIQRVSQRFYRSPFVVTCRIAAKEYTFPQFVEVEVADFDTEQIQAFATRWFEIKDLDFARDFMVQLEANPPIKELATNPLLLTLLCLEFEDSGDFPSDRAELYKRATATLLRKWDNKRKIRREQVYKQLSVQRKEDLLGQIASTTFEQKEYFFKQRIVEGYIAEYICNLPDAPTDTDALHVDSEAVLKSIEAQHGLLVERARGIYSFSHLAFQEYFTAQKIAEDRGWQNLVGYLTQKRWREVFLLTVGMLRSADDLLQLMKHQIDELMVGDEKLQEFLT